MPRIVLSILEKHLFISRHIFCKNITDELPKRSNETKDASIHLSNDIVIVVA